MRKPDLNTNDKKRIGLFLAAFLLGAAVAAGIGYAVWKNPAKQTETVDAVGNGEEAELTDTENLENGEASIAGFDSMETRLFQLYLENELTPQYGRADLGAQRQEVSREAYFDQRKNRIWTDTNGVACEEIYDLDGDGSEELLVFLLNEEKIIMRIYELKAGKIEKSAETTWRRPGDMSEYDLFWAVLRGDDDTAYLFFCDNYHGFMRDYDLKNAELYRYDGETLYTPLAVRQTADEYDGGVVYTAYQYDADTKRHSEKVVFDEREEGEAGLRFGHYRYEIGSLFDEYGIGLDRETVLNSGNGVYQNLTKANGFCELLRLQVWNDDLGVSSPGTSGVYHFNDSDIYDRFLNGELPVRIREGVWYKYDEDRDVDRDREWTFRELMDMVHDYYLERTGRFPYVEYAYLDCGGDGAEELAIRFVGIDIDGYGDDSDLTMVIACPDGMPEVIYARESWSRSQDLLRYHGCVRYYGSSGAMCQGFGRDYINGNGDIQSVYDAEQLSYTVWDLKVRLGYDNREEDYDSKYGATVTDYSIGDAVYSTLEFGTDVSDKLRREYRAYLEQHHTTIVTEEEIRQLAEQRAEELGMEKEWMDEEDLAWSYCYW